MFISNLNDFKFRNIVINEDENNQLMTENKL
jgi:hypothetical protein